MGYDLHITRRADWSDQSGPPIAEAEWQQAIKDDPDADIYYWYAGDISVKNPDPALIAKMVRLAGQLEARVQGDDGEIYGEDGSPIESPPIALPSPRPSIFNRLMSVLRRRKTSLATSFRVGQRVRDVYGRFGTI